MVFKTDIICNY